MLSYTHFTHDERISLHNFFKRRPRHTRDRSQTRPRSVHDQPPKTATPNCLKAGPPQYDYTLEKLRNMWPPEAIANRFRLENPGQILSTSTIYRAIRLLRFCRQYRHRSTASSAPHLREATAVWFGQQYRYRATAINV